VNGLISNEKSLFAGEAIEGFPKVKVPSHLNGKGPGSMRLLLY